MSHVSHVSRQRLGSVGDSAPPSDSSEGSGSETFEIVPEWALANGNDVQQRSNGLFINTDAELSHDSLNLENSGVLTENERAQVESFFSGLGTEVYLNYFIIFFFIVYFVHVYCERVTSDGNVGKN